ncbi:uncharacterized protein LOC125544969 isoform X3 [Triticum urartu]|uniref:uncharacterized protein LOC125544969 isoform X3 n=1 Tax=Triticum urartu TaxID=4572 RepID=UPI002042F458|nr:uncharacterized protein LOC125544969 isoform X3 [Triticum urartu]
MEPSSTQNAATLPELPATGSAPPLLGSVHPRCYEPRLPSRPSHASCTAAEEQRLVQFVCYQDFGVISNQDIRADECAVGIAQMTVKEGRQLSIVAEADELDSSNGSTEQHVSTVLDAEHGSKSWTPNLIDVERENRGWVRRHQFSTRWKKDLERPTPCVNYVQRNVERGFKWRFLIWRVQT